MANENQVYKNEFSHQMSQKYFKTKEPDVNFIFEKNGQVVKVPAHKDLLAVSSPVFDAMFNGELKEKGDVKIADTSAAAFKEFLQFYYDDEVKLTMDNIADVLNLGHKYDIEIVIRVAVDFIQKNLSSDRTMWCLKLAVRYQLDELKAFCKENIAKDPLNALDGGVGDDEDGPESPTKKQRPSSASCQQILAEALSIAKEVISQQLTHSKRMGVKRIFLSSNNIFTKKLLSGEEKMLFYQNNAKSRSRFWLSEIFFVDVYENLSGSKTVPLKGEITITCLDSSKTLFTKVFGMDSVERHIRLQKPIEIIPSVPYMIKIKPSVSGFARKMSKSTLANNSGLFYFNGNGCTLIQRVHFQEHAEF